VPDSSTGGYLAPTSSAPLNDDTLNDALQAAIVGVTGIDGTLVRPLWQIQPPVRPAITADWIAFGTTNRKHDVFPNVVHNPSGQGSDTLYRNEEIDVQISVYGPNSEANASLLRDSLFINQNLEALATSGLMLVEATDLVRTADLVNNQWWPRVDMTIRIRRLVERTYAILNLESAPGTIKDGALTVDFDAV
jgi:hypothetical protein